MNVITVTPYPSSTPAERQELVENGILAITWSIIAVSSLILNPLCIVVVWKTSELENVSRLFLISMTVFDLGVCVSFVIPAIGISVTGGWPFGVPGCIAQILVVFPCYFGNVVTLIAVNVERYVALVYPFKYFRYVNFRRSVIALVALHSISIVFLYLITMGTISHWDVLFVPEHLQCSFTASLDNFWYNVQQHEYSTFTGNNSFSDIRIRTYFDYHQTSKKTYLNLEGLWARLMLCKNQKHQRPFFCWQYL